MTNSQSANHCPIIKISNGLDNTVSVYDVFDSQDNGINTYTLLTTIASGTTDDKVQTLHEANRLIVAITGKIVFSKTNTKNYENFPVKEISVSYVVPPKPNPFAHNQPKPKKPKQPSFIVTNADLTIMTKMLTFIQLMDSNPNSKLTKAFNTALQAGTAKGGSLETSLSTFFNQYPDTKGCSVESWTAITNWMNSYASSWQGHYYLYNMPSIASLNASGANAAIKLIATLKVNPHGNTQCAKLTMAGSSGASYLLNFEPAKFEPTKNGKDSQKFQLRSLCYTDMSSDVSINLTPAWSKVKVKKNQTTTELGTCVSGFINNTKVYGTNEKLNLPKNNANGKENKYTNMINGIIKSVMSMGMLVFMLHQFQAKKKAAKTEAQKEKVEEQYGNEVQQQIDVQEKSAEQMEQDIKTVEVQNQLDEQMDEINELSSLTAPDTELEDLTQQINEAQSHLNADNAKEIGEQADGFQDKIQAIHNETVNQLTDSENADYEIAKQNENEFNEMQKEHPDFDEGDL